MCTTVLSSLPLKLIISQRNVNSLPSLHTASPGHKKERFPVFSVHCELEHLFVCGGRGGETQGGLSQHLVKENRKSCHLNVEFRLVGVYLR